MIPDNIFWSIGQVTQTHRWARNGHKGCIVWFTGLSGSGKSTLSRAVERELFERNLHPLVLDGDNLRHGLNSNLVFLRRTGPKISAVPRRSAGFWRLLGTWR